MGRCSNVLGRLTFDEKALSVKFFFVEKGVTPRCEACVLIKSWAAALQWLYYTLFELVSFKGIHVFKRDINSMNKSIERLRCTVYMGQSRCTIILRL